MKVHRLFGKVGVARTVSLAIIGLLVASVASAATVSLVRTPNDGIQPQAAIDSRGTVHLIYYKGEPGGGDIFYVRKTPGATEFSRPIQVNSAARSAIAAGTIRGAQMALGRNNRVHVAWNGPIPKGGTYMNAPMFYTRLDDAGTRFEKERDLIIKARGLDGGGSVAADNAGNVYVLWHAPKPGNTNGEAGRALFVACSTDDGKTFAAEKPATTEPIGACACCGMKAFADTGGNVLALYRAASEKVNRDETLLISRNKGKDFDIAYRHGWKIAACPMSSASMTETAGGVVVAGETHGRVFFVRVDPATGKVSEPTSPEVKAKHPAIAANPKGEVLLAWTEETAWAKGGSVAWQLYDTEGNATPEKGKRPGVPTWSLVAAFANADGSFTIVY